ncbi:MAG: hypothetical protein R3D51_02735 [Hyphomicrobiaceae bacterium]
MRRDREAWKAALADAGGHAKSPKSANRHALLRNDRSQTIGQDNDIIDEGSVLPAKTFIFLGAIDWTKGHGGFDTRNA